jgi:cation transport ATPase
MKRSAEGLQGIKRRRPRSLKGTSGAAGKQKPACLNALCVRFRTCPVHLLGYAVQVIPLTAGVIADAGFYTSRALIPERKGKDFSMNINVSLAPLVALIAGILILAVPRLLNYIVALYLIIIGLIGLFGSGNLFR